MKQILKSLKVSLLFLLLVFFSFSVIISPSGVTASSDPVEINIINVQSHPQVGKDWAVSFTTAGKADLTIRPVQGTTWSDSNDSEQLRFLEIKCDSNAVPYEWVGNSVVARNYECGETGTETSRVLIPGKHALEFTFGEDVKYAYNATITLVQQDTNRNAYNVVQKPLYLRLDVPATAGNLLVTGVAVDKASGIITTPAGFILISKGEGGVASGSFAYKIAAGGETTISWTWAANEEGSAWIGEYSGLATSNVFDVNSHNTANLSTPTTSISTGTTATTTQADELAIAMVAADSGNSVGQSRTWTNGFTTIAELPVPLDSGAPFINVAGKTLTSTGTVETTVSFVGTSNSDECYAAVATFKAAAAGTAPDANVQYPMAGESFNRDSVSTVDINVSVFDPDTNTFNVTIDINYSSSQTQGSGTVIVNDANLATLNCDSNNLKTSPKCKYRWTITGVTNGNYYILTEVNDGINKDFNAGAGTFAITSSNVPCDANVQYPMAGEFFYMDSVSSIDINVTVIDMDNNAFDLNIDLNYSSLNSEGSGTAIINDKNLATLSCDSNDLSVTRQCKYNWNLWSLNNYVSRTYTNNLGVITINASDIAYSPLTETVFVVESGSPTADAFIYEYTLGGTHLRTITTDNFNDVEGLAWMHGNTFVMSQERVADQRLVIVTIDRGTSFIDKNSGISIVPNITITDNKGMEGVTYDIDRNCFYVVTEKQAAGGNGGRVFRVDWNGDATELTGIETTLSGLGNTDLSSCYYDRETEHLFLLGQENNIIYEVKLDGTLIGTRAVDTSIFSQPEGLAFSPESEYMMIAGEDDDYQLLARPDGNYYILAKLKDSANSDFNAGASTFRLTTLKSQPDVNVLFPMAGEVFDKLVVSTIDINIAVSDIDTNTYNMMVDLNYSTTNTNGSGTKIIDMNILSTLNCDHSNLRATRQCKYTWDISSVPNGTYYILAKVNDGNKTDFNAGASTFTITSPDTAPQITINSPANETVSSNHFMVLDANVTEPDGDDMNIFVFGSNNIADLNTSLLYYLETSANDVNIDYNWNAPVMQPDNNTVALYHFDRRKAYNETDTSIYDFTGRGHTGTCPAAGNCVDFNAVGGKFAGAYYFDGAAPTNNDYFAIADHADFDMIDWTIMGWFNMTGAGDTVTSGGGGVVVYPIITKGMADAETAALDVAFLVGVRASPTNFCADIEFDYNSGNSPVCGSTTIQTNTWYHFAAVFNPTAGTFKVYLNGVENGSRTIDNRPAAQSSAADVCIGAAEKQSDGSHDGGWMGYIDELVIWETALSASEIASYYQLDYNTYYWDVNATEGDLNADSGVFNFILSAGQAPDATIWKVDNWDLNAALPSFSYSADGNLTIKFRTSDGDSDDLNFNMWYGTSANAKTTKIIGDINLSTNISRGACDTNSKAGMVCSWDWNISGIADSNYWITVEINDGSDSNTATTQKSFHVNPADAPTTCTCPASGHWNIGDASICTLSTTCSLANGSLHVSNGSLTITATGTLYVPDGYKVIIEKTSSKLVLEKSGKLIVKKWGFVEKPEYVVSGTLDPDATGTYYYAGIGEEGKPYYKRSDGSYYIFWSGFGSWVVDIGVGYANWYWWRESTDITGVYQTNPIYATGTLTVT